MFNLKFFTKQTITYQLLLWFLVITLIPLAIITWLLTTTSTTALTKEIQRGLVAVADTQVQRIENLAHQKQEDVIVLAKTQNIITTMEEFNKVFYEYGSNSIQYQQLYEQNSSLITFFVEEHNYHDLFLISTSGDIIFSTAQEDDFGTNLYTGSYKDTELARVFAEANATSDTKISNFEYYPPSNQPALFVATPIFKENTPIGIVIVQPNPKEIYDIVGNYTGLGNTGETLLGTQVNDEAVFIAPLRHDLEATFNKRVTLGSNLALPIQEAVQGKDGQGLSIDYRGEEIIAVWRYIPTFKWGMVTKIDADEALEAVNTQKTTAIWLSIITFIAVVSAATRVARSISTPIIKLRDIAILISQGDLSQKVPLDAKGEIGELGQAFNSMTTALQKEAEERHQAEIDLQVSEAKSRAIVEAAVDGLIMIDEQATVQSLNPAAEHIFQYTAQEVIGKNIKILMPEPYHSEHDGYLQHYLETGQKRIIDTKREVMGRRRDGSTFPMYLSVTEVILEQERVFAGSVRDISEVKQAEADNKNRIWQSTGLTKLNEIIQGEQDIPTLSQKIIQHLCQYLDVQVGTLYLLTKNTLKLTGSYAYLHRKNLVNQFKLGEGLVGQAALEKQPIIMSNVPDDYIKINSSLGESSPKQILVSPFIYEDTLIGLIELGSLTEFTPQQLDFIESAIRYIAVIFKTAQDRSNIDKLLAKSQQQTQELQVQEEELRATNEELRVQTESLQRSQAELEEKQSAVDEQNRKLQITKQELEQKAEELTLASKYKSEFLANMSHELRTPLNSLLILARMMAENKEGNLTKDQVESASIIYQGGHDLLILINDILDLSKVEAGKMDFYVESVPLAELTETMQKQFAAIAEEKNLEFKINLSQEVPQTIVTDRKRLAQIIKNLLSNALKFTHKGNVTLKIYRPSLSTDLSHSGLIPAQTIAMSVSDTGIGISTKKQKTIFEAFQQADGSTTRTYGGTGLGLSISKELATKLGGQITLESAEGEGSTFTLYIPETAPASLGKKAYRPSSPRKTTQTQMLSAPQSLPPISDDRDNLEIGDRILLIVEDDQKFAKVVGDFAHNKGFKYLIAQDGKIGLKLATTYNPTAIILDLKLPNMSGWDVLNNLKNNPDTRHIPVHIMSVEDETLEAYKKGAIGYLTKPVNQEDLDSSFQQIEQFITKEIKSVLLVEDDANLRESIKKLLGSNDIIITAVGLGEKAFNLLKNEGFDCMILDLTLPDMTGFDLLNKINSDKTISKCPIIVYTGKALSREENAQLMQYTNSIILKGAKSPERLLDETALFLHQVIANMPAEKQQTIKQLYNKETSLASKRILVVDDDVRNSFAISKLLSDKGLVVQIVNDGQKALDLLAKNPYDLVLMDIMMPVMDGFETIKRIREQPKFKQLPILALTAKAMKEDRDKCLAAGANDYLPKPVNAERLFSMLRVWLYH